MKLRIDPSAVCVTTLCAALLAGCRFEPDYDRYAIVYGLSDYQGLGSSLSYCDEDAQEMAALLSGQTPDRIHDLQRWRLLTPNQRHHLFCLSVFVKWAPRRILERVAPGAS